MYNEIQVTQIVKTGISNLIDSANNETGSIIELVKGSVNGLKVYLSNGQKFEITVIEVK